MNKIIYSFIFVFVVFASCKPEPETDSFLDTLGKRGVSFNILYEADFDKLKDGVRWAYNWSIGGYGPLADVAKKNSIAYVPMIRTSSGNWANDIRNYKKENPDGMFFLAFNEPNLVEQANMTPAQAAEKWPEVKALAKELKMQIISPAMNYGTLAGYGDPIIWLDEFFAQPGVSVNDVHALALHSYMGDAASVKSYVERFRKYNKPIWMTEFSAGESEITAEQQREFMCNVLNYFESDPIIARYAWFKYDGGGGGAGGSVSKRSNSFLRTEYDRTGELVELGKVYIYFSTFNKTVYYAQNAEIQAEQYSNCNSSEAVGTNKFMYGPQLKSSSDENGILEVADLDMFQWVEYQIAPDVSGSYQLVIRYASADDSKIKIYINGNEISEIALPKTGSSTTWTTITTSSISLAAGNQTVRIKPSQGILSLNWWKFTK